VKLDAPGIVIPKITNKTQMEVENDEGIGSQQPSYVIVSAKLEWGEIDIQILFYILYVIQIMYSHFSGTKNLCSSIFSLACNLVLRLPPSGLKRYFFFPLSAFSFPLLLEPRFFLNFLGSSITQISASCCLPCPI
jgi:hypothetical protein